ncbi:MAG: protein-ADP-ribose hydrolase, partial [Oscillospiraceae bacterium]|nr:protein-ADP-ribose hydrolase [Oscillospiraceae bacterium]
MDQSERCRFLIGYLLAERDEDAHYPLPPDADGQKRLLRALMNVRPASPVSEDFLAVQNEYLRERAREKGV